MSNIADIDRELQDLELAINSTSTPDQFASPAGSRAHSPVRWPYMDDEEGIEGFNVPAAFRREEKTPQPKRGVEIWALEYVSPVDGNLMCPICHCPFEDPRQLECDHTFCKECLDMAFHGQRNQPHTSCPTCRTYARRDRAKPVPRFVMRLLDELVVICPNKHCPREIARGDIEDHVSKYCDHTLVDCPDSTCYDKQERRLLDAGCMHITLDCDDCGVSLRRMDLQDHQRYHCPERFTTCPACSEAIPQPELSSHITDSCTSALVSCPGHAFGCPYSAERPDVVQHALACPIAAITPHLSAQKALQEDQAAQNKLLQRKVKILEGGFSAMQNILYGDSTTSPSPNVANPPLDLNDPTLTSLTSPTTTATNPVPPFDSPTTHLLSLHESLRAELSRLEAALGELDAKTTMMLINEGLRNKEDMAHANAAINGMRMQLHWLTSARLQQNQLQQTPSMGGMRSSTMSAAGPSGTTRVRAGAAVGSGGGSVVRDEGHDWDVGGGLVAPVLGTRRLSEQTKL